MATGDDIVAQARRVLGKPYKYGAEGPNSFDCSGLVKWCCDNIGITKCPRTSELQYAWGQPVSTPEAGDFVFFVGAEPDPPPGHVGIVIAPGQMIDAPHTGSVVQQASYGVNGVGVNKFMGYRRASGVEGGQGGAAEPSEDDTQAAASAGLITGYIAMFVVGVFVLVGVVVLLLFIWRSIG